MTLALVAALTLTGVHGHTPAEYEAWERGWFDRAEVALTPKLLAEWHDMRVRHHVAPAVSTSTQLAPAAHRGMGPGVTDWTGLVSAHFPPSEVATALRVIDCESGGNPNARNASSGAAGLFQIMPHIWAPHFGVDPDSLFAAEVNVAIARRVWEIQGWGAWECY